MYHILIVDDEPLIVDSLYNLLSDQSHLELNLCRAYNVVEAQQWLERTRIDIMLSDMRMPGMSGVELQKEALLKWPRCRIIFFTAYDDLAYAQQAIFNGKVSAYLTKNVENKEIVQAVEKAIAEIDNDVIADDMLFHARMKMKQVLPILQKDFLLKILQHEESCSAAALQTRFTELEIALQPDKPLFLLMCRIDAWKGDLSLADKTLLQYAVQNITDEFLKPFVSSASIVYDQTKLLWVMQGRLASSRSSAFGTLESVQLTCQSLFHLPVSFIISPEKPALDQLQEAFIRSVQFLSSWVHSGEEILMDLNHEPSEIKEFPQSGPLTRTIKSRIDDLNAYMESGQETAFYKAFSALMTESVPNNNDEALELYFGLAHFFMSYFNRTGTMKQLDKELNLRFLTAVSEQFSWPEIAVLFQQLAGQIVSRHETDQMERTQKLINRVHYFIQNHLGEDLSLTRIAEMVHHSPTYFSRLYKRVTGSDLSEYIAEQRIAEAKKLLKSTNLKIFEITAKVGYDSVPYFIRLFKKHVSMTPQEFRDYHHY